MKKNCILFVNISLGNIKIKMCILCLLLEKKLFVMILKTFFLLISPTFYLTQFNMKEYIFKVNQ